MATDERSWRPRPRWLLLAVVVAGHELRVRAEERAAAPSPAVGT